jgi:hypothetical protein
VTQALALGTSCMTIAPLPSVIVSTGMRPGFVGKPRKTRSVQATTRPRVGLRADA